MDAPTLNNTFQNSSSRGVVLVVDDDPVVRKLTRQLLSRITESVHAVANGEDAVRVAPQLDPDLILLDVNMPGMNGFDVCGYFLGNIGGEDHDLARAIEATACGEGGTVLIKPHVKDASAHYRKRAEQIGVVADYPFGLAEDTKKLRGPIGAAH